MVSINTKICGSCIIELQLEKMGCFAPMGNEYVHGDLWKCPKCGSSVMCDLVENWNKSGRCYYFSLDDIPKKSKIIVSNKTNLKINPILVNKPEPERIFDPVPVSTQLKSKKLAI